MHQKNFFDYIFHWNLTPKELAKELKEYETLSFFKTARGLVIFILIFFFVLHLLAALAGLLEYTKPQDVLLILIIFAPLAFFIKIGHRWAIVLLVIFWVLSIIIGIYTYISNSIGIQPTTVLTGLLWTFFILRTSYQALIVENARKKRK